METLRLDALVFDAYGTLFDVHSVASRCDHHFPGRGRELSALWRQKQLEYTWLRSLMGRYRDFWAVTGDALAHACRALGLACPEAVRRDLLDAYLRLETFPEVKGALSSLSRLPLAILSNGSPEMLGAVVRHQGMERTLAAVLSVDELRIYKPHPSVYELAPRRLGVPRERIGFVSSNAWDVAGAASFGLSALWVNRAGAAAEELGSSPARVLRGLDELAPLLP
jgi:2-haloacid dehalogenase